MSSRLPATVNYSLPEFARHGSVLRSNKSGWGIAFFRERDAFLVKEAEPAGDSPWVRFIADQELASTCVIAHIRYATVGAPALHNTHPFRRALGGQTHVFAHNGTLHGIHELYNLNALTHQPIGDTDSELAFCILLERLRSIWQERGKFPVLAHRLDIFAHFASELSALGSANLLYSDGDVLFVYAHRRVYEENGRLTPPRPPGLNMRDCAACETKPTWSCRGLNVEFGSQQTKLFASVPLGGDGWEPLPEGTVIAVRAGEEVARHSTT